MNRWARQVGILVANELRMEVRRPETGLTVVFLSLAVVLLVAFAGPAPGPGLAGVAIWLALTLASAAATHKLYARENVSGTLDALLSGVAAPSTVYVAKTVMLWLSLLAAGAVCTVSCWLLLSAPVWEATAALTGVLVSGTLGMALVVGLFGGGAGRGSSESLLAIAAMPIFVPLVVGGAQATQGLMATPADLEPARSWLPFLVGFDLVFGALGLWLFGPLIRR